MTDQWSFYKEEGEMASTAEALGRLSKVERGPVSKDRAELELYPSLRATVRAAVENRRVRVEPPSTSYGRETGARC